MRAKVGFDEFSIKTGHDPTLSGFLVHSCWVNDGRGNRFDLLDIDGCAVDPIIQPDIKYDESLNKAYVEAWGYKFSDTSVLNYQCVVELCKKAQGECDGELPLFNSTIPNPIHLQVSHHRHAVAANVRHAQQT
jgi:hypothetical protein